MHLAEDASEERASTSTSRSLLAGLHANDPGAWNRMVTLYAPLMWHWCRRMNLPEQEVPDILQEVFQAVTTRIGTFRKQRPTDTFRGWLRTILRNKVHDHFRRYKHELRAAGGSEAQLRLSQIPESDRGIIESEDTPAYRQLFHRALELIQTDFAERTWQAFWRVVVDGQSPQEVAAELAMTAGAVRVAKCRVLHRLRQELGDLPA
jgi:RNA polymerase sigma-70 factor, ECF subfamily